MNLESKVTNFSLKTSFPHELVFHCAIMKRSNALSLLVSSISFYHSSFLLCHVHTFSITQFLISLYSYTTLSASISQVIVVHLALYCRTSSCFPNCLIFFHLNMKTWKPCLNNFLTTLKPFLMKLDLVRLWIKI